MAKIQAVWAIDVGQAALKALKLAPGETPDALVAEAFDYVEYPKILSQPDADPEELVREALTTFLERNDLKGSKVAIGVSGQAGLVKFIKLPPVEPKRIPDIVKFEARQQIPFALEEVIWDYQRIGGDDKDKDDEAGEGFTMAEVGLFAMKRDQINRAILPLKNAGIEVDIVQMGPIALYNFAAFDRLAEPAAKPAAAEEAKAEPEAKGKDKPKGKAEPKGSVVLLDIGADNTDLIITDGTRIWQRNVPIGGNHFTRALTKELKLTFAKAEHLKRNATKAPDPRAVFTAMRGVFNDFSSEVNRSIGFYSSVNRQSKITKVIGLGNGFKLPGLQKFLQQNLSYEVEKLEGFNRLSGDEVVAAPQFQENLMSFAVAYGLAVQGLGKGPLKTNLLPPEIEQVRMIRRKKPWALAAAALLLMGFSVLFLSDWAAWAKVTSPAFAGAVTDAKNASKQGSDYKAAYEAAKGEFKKKYDEGRSLVGESAETTNWPELLKVVSATLPDPPKELGIDPNDPANVPVLSKLRVHVDAVIPVYRDNLDTGWYQTLESFQKDSMSALDRKTAPSGPGWVIQIIGHHYNPNKYGNTELTKEEQAVAYGPVNFLQREVIARFLRPDLRVYYGLTHPTLFWYESDRTWTSEKGASAPIPYSFPQLAKASPPAGAEGGAGGASGGPGGDMAGMMAAMQAGKQAGMQGSDAGSSGYGYSAGGPGARSGGMMPGMMPGMGYGMPGMGAGEASKTAKMNYLTRTNFRVDLVWKPKPPDERPKTPEDLKKAVEEEAKKLEEAAKDLKGALKPLDENAVAEASKKILATAALKQKQQIEALTKGVAAPGAATKGAPGPAAKGALAPAAATKGAMPPAAPATKGAAPAAGAAKK